MTRNDTFFKILFAIEIALLPLVIAANMLMPKWSIGLFVAGILIVKIWLELFKNRESKTHAIINAIGNVATVSTLVIFFTVLDLINIVLCVFVVIFAVLMNLLKVLMFSKKMPDLIDAVDSCYVLFECLTLIGLTFVLFYDLITNIGLFALLLTSIVSVAYKLFYLYKFYDVNGKIKNLFAKMTRRK